MTNGLSRQIARQTARTLAAQRAATIFAAQQMADIADLVEIARSEGPESAMQFVDSDADAVTFGALVQLALEIGTPLIALVNPEKAIRARIPCITLREDGTQGVRMVFSNRGRYGVVCFKNGGHVAHVAEMTTANAVDCHNGAKEIRYYRNRFDVVAVTA